MCRIHDILAKTLRKIVLCHIKIGKYGCYIKNCDVTNSEKTEYVLDALAHEMG